MNAADLKLHLLLQGLNIDYGALKEQSFKTDKYLHNDRHFVPLEKKGTVPQELLLIDESAYTVCVGVLARPESPFSLLGDSDGPYLTFEGKRINVRVAFLPEPVFWNMETRDGIPNYFLLSVPGVNELNLWPWHDCALHYEQEGCAFCTTTSTAVQAGTGPKSELLTVFRINQVSNFVDVFTRFYPSLLERSIDALTAALRYDFPTRDYWFTIISGNLSHDLLSEQHDLFGRLLEDLLQQVPELRRDRVVFNIMPPNDVGKLRQVKQSGASFYMANLEIWDESYFRDICPGKARYGRNRFIDMLLQAVNVFGAGNVWCNFVCGLEPLDLQLQGYSILAGEGIVCGANVFHRDPKVKLNAVEGFSFDSAKRYYTTAAEILHKNNLTPFFGLESRRSSLLWEAYLGLL
jgi:hypothetical protein